MPMTSLFVSNGNTTATFVYKLDQALRKYYKIEKGGMGASRFKKKSGQWSEWKVVHRYWNDSHTKQETIGKLSKVLEGIGWHNKNEKS